MTSSLPKSAVANQKRKLALLIELCDLEREGVVIYDPPPTLMSGCDLERGPSGGRGVINDPPPTPLLSEGSETSAITS